MIKKPVLGLCLLTLSSLVFSCAPKDAKLIRPGDQDRVGVQSADENLRMSFVVFDKQVEALVLIKALLNGQYAAASGVEVTTVSSAGAKVQKTLAIRNQVKENNNFIQTSNVQLTADLKFEQDILVAATIYNYLEQADLSILETKNPNSQINFNSLKKVITLKKIGATYVIETMSLDEIVNGKFTDMSKITSSMTLVWNGDEATLGVGTPISKITLSRLKLAQTKNEISLASTDGGLIVDLAGICWQLNGSLTVESGKKDKAGNLERFVFQFDNSNLKILGKKIESASLECANRPPVDLRKLQGAL